MIFPRWIPSRRGTSQDARAGVLGLTEVTTAAVGRLRHARALHPSGLVVVGTLTVGGHARTGSPLFDVPAAHPVVARLSKAAGLPSGLPDALGLALRILPDGDVEDGGTARPVDLMLTTSGVAGLLRRVPLPVLGWRAAYTSVLAYRTPVGTMQLVARGPQRQVPPSLTAIAAALTAEPLRFELAARVGAAGYGQPIGAVELEPPPGVHDARDLDDDPALRFSPANVPPGLRPPALTAWRVAAYTGSRRGFGS